MVYHPLNAQPLPRSRHSDMQGALTQLARYSAEPQELPDEWRHGLGRMSAEGSARQIADFIAGMTDRYALMEHARLFDSTPDLR